MTDEAAPKTETSAENDLTPIERPIAEPERRAFETLQKMEDELEKLKTAIEAAAHGIVSRLAWNQRTAQELDITVRHGVRELMASLERLRG